MTDSEQDVDTPEMIPLSNVLASVSVSLMRKKRTRQESVEWNTVRITKEIPITHLESAIIVERVVMVR